MQRIAQSLDTDGITARVHGLTKSVPNHALNEQDILRIKTCICRYAKDNALPLPGRLPNFRQSHVLSLPSDKSIADIHQLYEQTANDMEFRSISLRTFQRTWHNFCPHISVSKPCTDLCQKCQGYCVKVVNSDQFNEEEKAAMLADSFDELPLGQKHGNPPCTVNKKFHYSWDYAQQVYYPHHSRQVGPMFVKTPRKCDVFGVCSDGSGRKTFYLVDEAESKGKGANSVFSMVHHYFQYYGLGETDACIHFDNCCGQNKNNVVVQYAMWRVMTGLHQQLELAMMITGHTKFHPDWHFGV